MRVPINSVLVTLEDWEHEWASHVGEMRHRIRADSPDAAHYDPARMEDNLRASRASAYVEIAVAKYKQQYWGGHFWPVEQHNRFKALPDVEPNYECRRVREPHNPVAVRRRDVRAKRLLAAGWADNEDERLVWLIGEVPASEVWKYGAPAEYDPQDTRLVPQSFFDHYVEQ